MTRRRRQGSLEPEPASIEGKALVPTGSKLGLWDAAVHEVLVRAEHTVRDTDMLPDEQGLMLRIQQRKLETLVAELEAGEKYGSLPDRVSEDMVETRIR